MSFHWIGQRTQSGLVHVNENNDVLGKATGDVKDFELDKEDELFLTEVIG